MSLRILKFPILKLLILFITGNGGLCAQNPLLSFYGQQVKDSILIFFTMKGGFSCNGIGIERSEDSVSFYPVGDIQGICGSPDFDVSFSFTDTNPLNNQKNFYRLDLKQYGYSQVISVFFLKIKTNGAVIIPNPCKTECRMYFENEKKENCLIEIFSNGNLVYIKTTNDNYIGLSTCLFSSGLYHYRITRNEREIINGAFAVIH